MQLHGPSSVRVEQLSTLFPEFCRYAIACCKRLGCFRPEECGTDALTEFLDVESANAARRVTISGEDIVLNFPYAKDQRKVLATFVKFKVRNKHHHCKDCRHLKECRPLKEDYSREEDDGPHHGYAVVSSPKTPEEIYAAKELLGKLINAAPKGQRPAIIGRILGYSSKEIARQLHKKPEAVRKGLARLRPKVENLFGRKRRGGRKQ